MARSWHLQRASLHTGSRVSARDDKKGAVVPYSLHIIPYGLHIIPYSLHIIPYGLYVIPYGLHVIAYGFVSSRT